MRYARWVPPRQVYRQPETRQIADYFGNCVYSPGQVERGFFTAPGIRCPVSKPEGSYTLMLRPDCLNPDAEGDYLLTVEDISFRGSDTLVSFRSGDGILWKKSCSRDVQWQPGDMISAKLQIADPVLF